MHGATIKIIISLIFSNWFVTSHSIIKLFVFILMSINKNDTRSRQCFNELMIQVFAHWHQKIPCINRFYQLTTKLTLYKRWEVIKYDLLSLLSNDTNGALSGNEFCMTLMNKCVINVILFSLIVYAVFFNARNLRVVHII